MGVLHQGPNLALKSILCIQTPGTARGRNHKRPTHGNLAHQESLGDRRLPCLEAAGRLIRRVILFFRHLNIYICT